MKKSGLRRALLAVVAAVFLCGALPASAATVAVTDTYALPTSSSASQNLYVAAGTAILSGPVHGDSVIAAGDATIAGQVTGGALVAAGTLDVLGPIGNSLRAIGGKLTLGDTSIGGDTALAGGFISILSHAHIAGSALLAGVSVSMLGDVTGDVYIAARDVYLDGTVSGNVHIYGTDSVRIGPNAVINGDLFYHSSQQAQIDPNAVIKGKTQYLYLAPVVAAHNVRGFFAALMGFALVIRILILVAASLFFILVFRRASGSLARVSTEHFWRSVVIGLCVLVAAPIAIIAAFLTILGALVAVAALVTWLLLLVVGQAYAGVVLAAVFRKYVIKHEVPVVIPWQDAVLGTAVLGVISLIPYVGLFVCVIFFLGSLGALSSLAYKHFLVTRK